MGEMFGWDGESPGRLAAPVKTVEDKWKLVPAFLKVVPKHYSVHGTGYTSLTFEDFCKLRSSDPILRDVCQIHNGTL